jgi:hypothetical protein
VTLPEVVTSELASKFGKISLFNHHADFKLESASNSNLTSPWAIACELAAQPSHVVPPIPRAPHARPPQLLQGPHGGSLFAPGRQGARTRVQLGLRHRPWPCFGLQPPLRVLLGFRIRVRLQVGPRGSRVRGQHNRASLIRPGLRAGYNIHARRKIRLLARPQDRGPDKRRLTLRRLPRLALVPGGNTTFPG